MIPEPRQPDESRWSFVNDLQAPLWTNHHWKSRTSREGEAHFSAGVTVDPGFPDPLGTLATAYDDLHEFLRVGAVATTGAYTIATRRIAAEVPESFEVEVTPAGCTISAGDTEGIRRGLFHIEDEMLRAGGPFLPLGSTQRTPFVTTRISRCFFGPIKRPPKNRDELADDVNYYPDGYLNRLAHDGVNALWLSIRFADVCPSRFFPDYGKDAPRRLEKLRQTVRQCARYGIKIYVFCIEPNGFGTIPEYTAPLANLEKHPELAGHKVGGLVYFCTSSETGQQYIEEATFGLFDAVPGLGGMITINLGERPSHCYSATPNFTGNNCPRCGKRKPWEVFADTLSGLARGMHRANPRAELISWLYVPYMGENEPAAIERDQEVMRQIAAHAPPEVTLQVNFESNAVTQQCGGTHTVRDYSLAFVGPSDLFADCARGATAHGARVSAKLQVGCSHEIATVPFVPAPGNLFRKYSKMQELGVGAAMQCWYFGNYPSLMTKAAGLLGFLPLATSEAEFLLQLAGPDWGDDARTVAAAWQCFRDAYADFPVPLQFSWFGPVHDSICWPLHLVPVDEVVAPSWLLGFAPTGDRVAECFAYELSLPDTLELCREMADRWAVGVRLLQGIKTRFADRPDRMLDIGVAQALGLQLRSAHNVLTFYALRDALPYQSRELQLQQLDQMRNILQDEIGNSSELCQLAQADSRLGFHSEAEGYKYFPEKLQWRIEVLQALLERDFPAVRAQVLDGKPLFPAFTGTQPEGPIHRAATLNSGPLDWTVYSATTCDAVTMDANGASPWATSWQAAADNTHLHVRVACASPASAAPFDEAAKIYEAERVVVSIEPRRCWPTQQFRVGRLGKTQHENRSSVPNTQWQAQVEQRTDGWEAVVSIPWGCLREDEPIDRPMRINVERIVPGVGTLGWLERHPLHPRLVFGTDNPRDYGWLTFG